jgi:hypothetical protein
MDIWISLLIFEQLPVFFPPTTSGVVVVSRLEHCWPFSCLLGSGKDTFSYTSPARSAQRNGQCLLSACVRSTYLYG